MDAAAGFGGSGERRGPHQRRGTIRRKGAYICRRRLPRVPSSGYPLLPPASPRVRWQAAGSSSCNVQGVPRESRPYVPLPLPPRSGPLTRAPHGAQASPRGRSRCRPVSVDRISPPAAGSARAIPVTRPPPGPQPTHAATDRCPPRAVKESIEERSTESEPQQYRLYKRRWIGLVALVRNLFGRVHILRTEHLLLGSLEPCLWNASGMVRAYSQ